MPLCRGATAERSVKDSCTGLRAHIASGIEKTTPLSRGPSGDTTKGNG